MAGTLTIGGQSTGDPAGTRTFGPFTINGATVSGETLEVLLAQGDNTYAIPPGMTAALIIPPSTTATLKLRTNVNNTDGGLQLNAGGQPFVYPFPTAAPTSLIVNASVAQTALTTIAFI